MTSLVTVSVGSYCFDDVGFAFVGGNLNPVLDHVLEQFVEVRHCQTFVHPIHRQKIVIALYHRYSMSHFNMASHKQQNGILYGSRLAAKLDPAPFSNVYTCILGR